MVRLVTVLFLFTLLPVAAELPYAKHGWTKEEASAHLLSRFSYGPRPGEVQAVAKMGLETWLEQQLLGDLPDPTLEEKLAQLPPAYALDSQGILEHYPRPAQIRKMAEERGIARDDRPAIQAMLKESGLRPYQELGFTLFAQKLAHARHSENALREVLTDFWFNHFNVSLSHNQARNFLLSYERDAIRPQALSDFRSLLGATAKHPAMLVYLDNANSTASKDATSTMEARLEAMGSDEERAQRIKQNARKRKKGLNENYARELLELHTLGVDGGYSQNDVVEVARALTGWTVNRRQIQQVRPGALAVGQFVEGDFRFAAPLHDAGSKTILGRSFPAGGGVEEGERVLDLLAQHPATAQHLANKLALRFISDQPEPQDVKVIAQAFESSKGDIKQTMRALAHSEGFWKKSNRQAKVKSPFEYVISANRALDGDLYPSRQVYGWMAKMGQPLFNYQAPTGFPDQADFWVSSASVLNRLNFALQAATGGVPGFTYPIGPTITTREALEQILPFQEDLARSEQNVNSMLADSQNLVLDPINKFEARPNLGGRYEEQPIPRMRLAPTQKDQATMIGLILSTPEFQRR